MSALCRLQAAGVARMVATNYAPLTGWHLLGTACMGYYQNPLIIAAMGWPVDPPQPQGYPLPAFDETLLAQLRHVRPCGEHNPCPIP